MYGYSADEVTDALRPLASLISKSEKAQQKLAPDSWQYAMLRDNLKALRHAQGLMSAEGAETSPFTPEEFEDGVRAIDSMIGRTEKAQAMFAPGTSQHTLQRNRLKALQIARAYTLGERECR